MPAEAIDYIKKMNERRKFSQEELNKESEVLTVINVEKRIFPREITKTKGFQKRYLSSLTTDLVINPELIFTYRYNDPTIGEQEKRFHVLRLIEKLQSCSVKYLFMEMIDEKDDSRYWLGILKAENENSLSHIQSFIDFHSNYDCLESYSKNFEFELEQKKPEDTIKFILNAFLHCEYQIGNFTFEDICGPNVFSLLQALWYKFYPNGEFLKIKATRVEKDEGTYPPQFYDPEREYVTCQFSMDKKDSKIKIWISELLQKLNRYIESYMIITLQATNSAFCHQYLYIKPNKLEESHSEIEDALYGSWESYSLFDNKINCKQGGNYADRLNRQFLMTLLENSTQIEGTLKWHVLIEPPTQYDP